MVVLCGGWGFSEEEIWEAVVFGSLFVWSRQQITENKELDPVSDVNPVGEISPIVVRIRLALHALRIVKDNVNTDIFKTPSHKEKEQGKRRFSYISVDITEDNGDGRGIPDPVSSTNPVVDT